MSEPHKEQQQPKEPYLLIPLTKGLFSMVDPEDFDRINQFRSSKTRRAPQGRQQIMCSKGFDEMMEMIAKHPIKPMNIKWHSNEIWEHPKGGSSGS